MASLRMNTEKNRIIGRNFAFKLHFYSNSIKHKRLPCAGSTNSSNRSAVESHCQHELTDSRKSTSLTLRMMNFHSDIHWSSPGSFFQLPSTSMPKSSGFSSHPKERSSRPLKSLNSVFRRDSASASTSSAASKPRGKIGPPAAANANATGYAKRQERRAQKVGSASSATFLDAYEYDGPGRGGGKNSLGRRMNVGLEVDKDELVGQNGPQSAKSTKRSKNDEDEDSGNGSDGEESGAATLRRKITANMEADFGVVESEDDESLDSDEAFEGESDEEKFSNFKFAANVSTIQQLVFHLCLGPLCFRVLVSSLL